MSGLCTLISIVLYTAVIFGSTDQITTMGYLVIATVFLVGGIILRRLK